MVPSPSGRPLAAAKMRRKIVALRLLARSIRRDRPKDYLKTRFSLRPGAGTQSRQAPSEKGKPSLTSAVEAESTAS